MWKKIPLTQGQVALVDAEDYESLAQFKWQAVRLRDSQTYYARRRQVVNGRGKSIYMHRVIMQASGGQRVDHRQPQKTLDNRRSNLRFATNRQNLQNRPKCKGNRSGYKGVTWNGYGRNWTAKIGARGKTRCLGCYLDKREAARAYDQAARKYFGAFAYLNFPHENQPPTTRLSPYKLRNGKSGFRGVSYHGQSDCWLAQICVAGKLRRLGCYTDKEEAARAYDRAARRFHRDKAILNFPASS